MLVDKVIAMDQLLRLFLRGTRLLCHVSKIGEFPPVTMQSGWGTGGGRAGVLNAPARACAQAENLSERSCLAQEAGLLAQKDGGQTDDVFHVHVAVSVGI
jgi:hypothetical protein